MNHVMAASDTEIRAEVARQLAWDTRILLEVADRVVTLTGAVDSCAKFRSAEQGARRVAGVRKVVNKLAVNIPEANARTDAELAEEARQALAALAVPVSNVAVTVSDGVVILSGEVESWSQRYDAEQASERLGGALNIVNRIAVAPCATLDLEPAHAAVARALRDEAIREASHIDLRVLDGVVHVRGVVESEREKEVVLGAVRATGGVGPVADELVLRAPTAPLDHPVEQGNSNSARHGHPIDGSNQE